MLDLPFGLEPPQYRRALLARSLRLPPPRFGVRVARAIPVPMPDGVRLLADHYAPVGASAAPTILIRTPYGRARETPFGPGLTLAELPAQRFAERGYHVLVQGVRGCFASEGTFAPHEQEAADGAATVDWLVRQPWFGGALAGWGPSYLGYAQWATAAGAPGSLRALVPMATSAEVFSVAHPDGAFGLETRLRWAQSIDLLQALARGAWHTRIARVLLGRAEQRLRRAFMQLPLEHADIVAVGRELPFYRAALGNPTPDALFWRARDHSAAVAGLDAPAHFVGGWHDYFLRGLLRDYATLRDAGQRPQLTIGPWHHTHPGLLLAGLREGLRWFDLHLRGEGRADAQPVRIFVTGANEWRALDSFPPAAPELRFFLHSEGRLARDPPPELSPPDRYRYDPSDPTPAVGGALLGMRGAGPQDNRALEARADVCCYTTPPLAADLELIGVARLELFARSSRAHCDFFARICDVYPDGRSINICDGLLRVAPGVGEALPDGTLRLEIALHPAAHRVVRGHRLRLQVSSGAHPRWSRQLGGGEPLASSLSVLVADQAVYHDSARPSALVLPAPAS